MLRQLRGGRARRPLILAASLLVALTVAPLAAATSEPGPGPSPDAKPAPEPSQRTAKAPDAKALPGYGVWRAPKHVDKPQPPAKRAPNDVRFPKDLRLSAALQQLGGADERALAAQNGFSVAKLKEVAGDSTARVAANGGLYFIDPVADPKKMPKSEKSTPIDAPFPLADTFVLHSKPGSTKVLFLDFDGYVLPSGTAWKGGAAYNAPAYDSSGDGAAFNNTELGNVQNIWQRVAEDYAGMDIDVTTQYPGYSAINRADASDTTYGGRVVITGATNAQAGICSGCGGVSYVGVIDNLGANHDYYQPSWVFAPNVAGNKATAEATSHEFGHAAGLSHDGTTTGDAYYTGHNQWAPIMGVGYYRPVVQFSKGEYANANNTEDDFAVMANNGLAQRADDHGSAFGSGTWIYSSNATQGVIESSSDGDMFQFRSCGGSTTISANPSPSSPNLDARLFLYNSSNGYIASDDPASAYSTSDVASGMSASLTQNLTYGEVYQVWVDRASRLPADTGYSTYGTRGHFQVKIDQSTSCDLYAMVDDAQTPSYTVANGRWANPSGGGAPTVNRSSTGTYSVSWPGASVSGGNVQVTSMKPAVTCNSTGWGASSATVQCRNSAGSVVNSTFSILYTLDDDSAYVWASSPSTASYTPSSIWSHNPSGRGTTVSRTSTGRYQVYFPGFTGADGGDVQVTAYSSAGARCVSNGWSTEYAYVACYDSSGAAVDSLFNLLYTKRQTHAYAWADQPNTTAAYSPSATWTNNPSGGATTIKRQDVGRYKVKFAGVTGGLGNVQVSGYSANANCAVRAWSNNSATVGCTNGSGAYVDSYYDVLFIPAAPITCQSSNVTVDLAVGDKATGGNDVILGTTGNDVINGLGGNDKMCGGDGKDGLNGGPGNDTIAGGQGNDILDGDVGTDTLNGLAGNDTLRGGDGNDTINGGDGNDTMRGDDNNDTLNGGPGNDKGYGGLGVDKVLGAGGNDRLAGDGGSPDVCNGGPGTDTKGTGCETVVGIP